MSIKTHPIVSQLPKQAIFCMLLFILASCRPGASPEPNPAQEDTTPTAVDHGSSPAPEQSSGEPATAGQTAKVADEESPKETLGTQDAGQTIHFGTVEELEIALPIGWEAASLGATEIRYQLDSSTEIGSNVAVQEFLEATDDKTTVLVAAFTGPPDAGTPQPMMTVSMIPRHDLPLNQYVEEFAAGLSSVSGIDIVRAGLLYDVRTNGAPVGIVAYVLPPSDGKPDLAGYHIAQFDAGGENLVLMNWVAANDAIESMVDDIHATAASIGPPSANAQNHPR